MELPNRTTMALLAGVAVLLAIIAIFAATRDSDQDRLGDVATLDAVDPDLNKACDGQPLYEQIKRALFRQAGQSRSDDDSNFAEVGRTASVRMENPAGEDRLGDLVNCSGSLSIDLPPGATTVAGRRRLMTDIYYTVDTSGGGSGRVVQLRDANLLVEQLAGVTVSDVSQPRPVPEPMEPGLDELAPLPEPGAPALPPPTASAPPASPSFDCSRARSRGEKMVCSDPRLAELDRAMAAEYQRAMAAASPQQAGQLRQTRDRFLAFRDTCVDAGCVQQTYQGRMREIRDIMTGRWRPQR